LDLVTGDPVWSQREVELAAARDEIAIIADAAAVARSARSGI